MLESFGYNVTSITSTAREAIKKAKEQNPDLILMDIHLNGEINGLEAARRIRNCFDVPLVFITALPDDSTFQQAKLTEPFGYIHKPIEDKELYATVEMALYKHKMERKLKESEQMFRSIFESTNEFIHILDKDGKIIQTNPATIQQSGYKKNEFVGKGLAHFLTPDSKENFEEHFKFLRKKGHSRLELEFVEKDGTVITVDCSTSAIRNKHGEVLSYVSFQHDITKKKEIEQMKSEFVSQVSHE
ncbi:MAG: PAS domain S-box protein, partial [Candidatus Aminicenantaceae bacterium]